MISAESRRMAQLTVGKLQAVLESLCSKLARYDEGTLFASFLSFTVNYFISPGTESFLII